jgi:GNAT superfamily N-acetyltransferase
MYNVARTGQDYWRYVRLFVRDEKGLIRGGLLGAIWGGWLHVTDLWLEESLRGSGLGRSLIAMAEDEARDEGCRYVHLDSHSFQRRTSTRSWDMRSSAASRTPRSGTSRCFSGSDCNPLLVREPEVRP